MFDNNIFSVEPNGSYRLLDEFLRIRIMMDGSMEEDRWGQTEQRLLMGSWTLPYAEYEDPEEEID